VLIGQDGQVKLVDFGVAKAMESEAMTRAGTIKGKYGYISPEQLRCEPVDNRADVFGVGVLLFESTVGRQMFRKENDFSTWQAVLFERYPLPSDYVPDYPADLEKIIVKATAPKPEDRFSSATELGEALAVCAAYNNWQTDPTSLGRFARDVAGDLARPNITTEFTALFSGQRRLSTTPPAIGTPARTLVGGIDQDERPRLRRGSDDSRDENALNRRVMLWFALLITAASVLIWTLLYP
jgi:serine/threonine protein kinase